MADQKEQQNMLNIIKQQKQEIDALKNRITALESESHLNHITDKDINSIFNEIDRNETKQQSVNNDSTAKPQKKKKRRTKQQRKIFDKLVKAMTNSNINECKQIIESNFIDVHDRDLSNMTLLIHAARTGQYEMCEILLNMGADINHKDKNNKSAIDHSRDGAFYHVEQLLYFRSLGADMGNRVKSTTQHINQQNGIIDNIFRVIKQKKNNISLNNVITIMLDIIEQKVAFSDDMLNIAWMETVDEILQKKK
eukprot:382976_1